MSIKRITSTIADKKILEQAVDIIQAARQHIVRQTNSVIVFTYYQIGRLIVEHEQAGKTKADYGKATLADLSKKLTEEFGKGFSIDNLENMRKFYLSFSISETVSRKLKALPAMTIKNSEPLARKSIKTQTVPAESFANIFPLSWSHYVILSRIKNKDERSFYETEAINGNWGKRELQRQFDSSLYERLTLSKNKNKIKQLAAKGQIIEKPQDIIKEPYVLEFLGLEEKSAYSENDLETAIINKIEHFLIEMGKGFLFHGRQVRFTFDEDNFFVDLVLYNRLLHCFVLVDLKIGKLKHQDIGQMQMYVNYFDRYVKEKKEKQTIGIIICKDKSDAMVEITLPKNNKQIFASQYKLYLPTKAELIKMLTE